MFHRRSYLILYLFVILFISLAFAAASSYRGTENNKAKNIAEEALYIANRFEYRLNLAEINNFLAKICLESNELDAALAYSQEAINQANCDGTPYCYKPELEIAYIISARIKEKNIS